MTQVVDVVVVGAGIVGLATAYRLLDERPGLGVLVVDKEDRVGGHQSSHNSGVIHAGLYYAPGSLKAQLCTEGKTAMEAFASEHDIPFERNGKLVVAVDHSEMGRFEELWQRCLANGVEGVRRLGADQLAEIEPNVVGVAGIHSPTTGVIDFARVCGVLAQQIIARGGEVRLGAALSSLDERPDGVHLVVGGAPVTARAVVTCTGVQSDRVAALAAGHDDERIIPFRGSWVELTGASADLVRGNIYPVPDPTLPFLGVHATRGIDGRVMAGPNAVLSGAREDYRRRYAIDRRDLADTLRFPGFWKLARRYVGHGAREVFHDVVTSAYVAELRRYVPDVQTKDVVRGPWGIRAQALRADGTMVDDFSLDESARVVHVRNAPSPAATSSLAIGRMLAAKAVERLS